MPTIDAEDERSKQERKRWTEWLKASGVWKRLRLLDWDIEDCENDFELVVRASKEMEWVLENDFGAPNSTGGLAGKINSARTANGEPLPAGLVERMNQIREVRNALVHQRATNAIPDRGQFLIEWRALMSELSLERGRAQRAKNSAFWSFVLGIDPTEEETAEATPKRRKGAPRRKREVAAGTGGVQATSQQNRTRLAAKKRRKGVTAGTGGVQATTTGTSQQNRTRLTAKKRRPQRKASGKEAVKATTKRNTTKSRNRSAAARAAQAPGTPAPAGD